MGSLSRPLRASIHIKCNFHLQAFVIEIFSSSSTIFDNCSSTMSNPTPLAAISTVYAYFDDDHGQNLIVSARSTGEYNQYRWANSPFSTLSPGCNSSRDTFPSRFFLTLSGCGPHPLPSKSTTHLSYGE